MRELMIKIIFTLFISFLIINCDSKIENPIKEGDLIFHESTSSQSEELMLSTRSKYTHMGIIHIINGKFYVYEAVQPVGFTPLDKWISRGKNKHHVIKRLRNADELLTHDNIKKMKEIGKHYFGRDYDNLFQWNDNKIYCSELVWKIYKNALNVEIGKLQKFKDFDLTNPKVKALIQ